MHDAGDEFPSLTALADRIAARLSEQASALQAQFGRDVGIRHLWLDDLLGARVSDALLDRFPGTASLHRRQDLRERKWVSAQLDRHPPALATALYAFQHPAVVAAVRSITGKADLEPDAELYAAGLSRMQAGDFLNPHLDNSHDGERRRWRNLNLLYYLSPITADPSAAGGELELWPEGPQGEPQRIEARHDRLVIMETHPQAWHSVRRVEDDARRCCLSNYYFAATPMRAQARFHVTSFRGRPDQPLRDLLLRADAALRMCLRRVFPLGLVRSSHRYAGARRPPPAG